MPCNNVILGKDVVITHPDLVNIYGCKIGDETKIGPFVEVQKGCSVGKRCKVSSHSFICEGVTIEDNVMIAHGVMFTNDLFPSATNPDGSMQSDADWEVVPTRVCRGVSIGSNATILAGIVIAPNAIIGAGAVVTQDIPENAIAAGVPARILRFRETGNCGMHSKVAFLKHKSAEQS